MNVRYTISDSGETSIENYDRAKPFSSFFPGIAGPYGIPMWVFYVNRGQCIASFGIGSKDKSILEFFPANRSYQLTPLLGFRSFAKVTRPGNSPVFYEPFQTGSETAETKMTFSPAFLRIEETNKTLGLKTCITYQTVPNENFPALARKVEIQNLSDTPISLEWIDGLPWIAPYGLNSWILKNMSRTGEAWVEVKNVEQGIPFYKLKVEIADRPEVEIIEKGHFSIYYDENGLLPALIDPESVFGSNTALSIPEKFWISSLFMLPTFQTHENYTPCAMTYLKTHLLPAQIKTFFGVFGTAKNLESASEIAKKITVPNWFDQKKRENETLLFGLKGNCAVFSSSPAFDQYSEHTFLDNALRGGFPILLPSKNIQKPVYYLYSRKHGDLERDYNHFSLDPSFLSQGNGNYRDVNQNRRNDLWFNPGIGDCNIRSFLNLIQLDGYNPLLLKGLLFKIPENVNLEKLLRPLLKNPKESESVKKLLQDSFSPGALLTTLFEKNITLSVSQDAFLESVLSQANSFENAEHGEGFWSDHWTYNLDLIESYLSLFPENKKTLLFDTLEFTYYQNAVWVNPRSERYILRNGKPFQTNSLREDHSLLKSRKADQCCVRTKQGNGPVYKSNLFGKLLCLVVNKMATLDPLGVGIEFEAGKPNWYDSLNGLPGLFGSSTNETLELKRLIQFLACLDTPKISLPVEIEKFLKLLNKLLRSWRLKKNKNDFEYWDESATLKERYRKSVELGISGLEKTLHPSFLKSFFEICLAKLNRGLSKAFDPKSGVLNSYFINEVSTYVLKKIKGKEFLFPKKFKQIPTALFLEAPVHFLKCAASLEEAKKQYHAVKSSNLYDTKLKMYKVCASLSEMPKELGRCTVFSPGWLENESIWLHMEYKYLLEILRSGQYDAFFEDFKNALVPFQDPAKYGRSTLENSSFIVSSANDNTNLHGNGFVARLSGATAEFIHILRILNLGENPFTLTNPQALQDSQTLCFQPKPILPHWLFEKKSRTVSWLCSGEKQETTLPEHHYAFVLFGKTLLVYVNPKQKNTYGKESVSPAIMTVTDWKGQIETLSFSVNDIRKPQWSGFFAEQVRRGDFKTIVVTLK